MNQNHIDINISNAIKLSEKSARGAMDNLLKGETDKVTHLATVRQLSNLLNNISNGRSEETT